MGSKIGKFFWENKWLMTVLLYLGVMLAVKQTFLTYDLGRHLTTGRVFVEEGLIVNTNFYSYTQPDLEVINHHWLAGVVFYLVSEVVGFKGLSILYIGLFVTATGLLAIANHKLGDAERAGVVFWLAPLLYTRTEIRPEAFTYLLVGILWWMYARVIEKRLNIRWLWTWPFLMAVWVNLHIYFLVGWALGVLLIERLYKLGRISGKYGFWLLLVFSGALFLNPNGADGVFYPLSILSGYGYAITENQPVIEYLRYISDPNVYHYVVVTLITMVSSGYLVFKKKLVKWEGLVVVLFGVFSWFMVRNIWFMAMAVLVIGSSWWQEALKLLRINLKWLVLTASIGLGVLILGVNTYADFRYYLPDQKTVGIGLSEKTSQPLEWLERNELGETIFNNYDIGGFLIFATYPDTKVYVDNRPEAYTEEFFDEYIRLQRDEKYWLAHEDKFSAIVFAYTDQTPWAQPFLTRRLQDPMWEMVYKDNLGMVVFLPKEKPDEL